MRKETSIFPHVSIENKLFVKFIECVFSGVGLKETVGHALWEGGVDDEHKLNSMCRCTLQKSDSTVKKYYCYVKKWKLICDKNSYEMMPAQLIHIALYSTELLDRGVTYCVI